MNLNAGQADGRDGIAQGDTGVGVSARVKEQTISPSLSFMDRVDKRAFMVGLKKTQFDLGSGRVIQSVIDISQAEMAIYIWFALAKEIQIRTMKNEDFNHGLHHTVKPVN